MYAQIFARFEFRNHHYMCTTNTCSNDSHGSRNLLQWHYFGPNMSFGWTLMSNSSSVSICSDTAAIFNVDPVVWACLAIFAARSYPMCGFSAVTSIRDSFTKRLILSVFGIIPSTQFLENDTQESPISLTDCSTFVTITGLNTFNWKWPLLPPTVTATWFPITWAATMVTASHCVGFTFPKCHINIKHLGHVILLPSWFTCTILCN